MKARVAEWLARLRKQIKNDNGLGWGVRGVEVGDALKLQITYRYENGDRSAALVNIAFESNKNREIQNTVADVKRLMTDNNLSLPEAVKLSVEPLGKEKASDLQQN